eukprot:11639223-Alexandrium_andersonii.AAC.1
MEHPVGHRAGACSYALLGLDPQPQGYRLRNSKVRAFLLGKCLQVGSVFDWAEKQLGSIGEREQCDAANLIPG